MSVCLAVLLVVSGGALGGAAAQGFLDRMLYPPDTGRRVARTNAQVLAAEIAASPESVWKGRWEGSCRLPGAHDMNIAIAGNQLVGEVITSYGRAGMFTAEVKGNGRFAGSLSGLADRSIPVRGRIKDAEIKGSWSYPRDCGDGKFALTQVAVQPLAGSAAPGTQPNDKVEGLTSLLEQGLITEAEYEAKLERFYKDGLITQAEFEQRRAELAGTQ